MCIDRQRGVTLVELIMYIVIVSVAAAGVLLVMTDVTAHSADTLIRKQSLAIAESLLEEVEAMPLTYCNPDDVNAAIALGSSTGNPAGSNAGCNKSVSEDTLPLGPEAGESRYAAPYFDNVSDYNGFAMAGGIRDLTGAANAALNGYSASIAVAQQGIPAAGGNPPIAAQDALLITVTVTGPDGAPVRLDGYRTRYAPNGLP